MLIDDDIVDIEKPFGIFSAAFVVNEFWDYFYINQTFLLNIQDLHKQNMVLYQIFGID